MNFPLPNFVPERKRNFARVGKHEVLLADSTMCPHCSRFLRASDVIADFGDVSLVCGGCHKDVLVIRGAS
jgi:hypothetical protein